MYDECSQIEVSQEGTQMTINEFIDRCHITMTARRLPTRPDQPAMKWHKTATHWECVFTRPMDHDDWTEYHNNSEPFTADPHAYEPWVSVGDPEIQEDDTHTRSLIVYYSQGAAHTEPPTTANVLDAYRSDAASGTVNNFGDFMAEWFSADDRFTLAELQAHQATYAACQLADSRLARWLTDQKYQELAECEYQ